MLSLLRFQLSTLDLVALVLFALVLVFSEFRRSWLRIPHKVTAPESCVRRKTVRDVPGPTALPLLGTQWLFSAFGPYKLSKMHEAYQELKHKYGRIVREEATWNIPVISLFEKEAIERVAHYPSKAPVRPPTLITVFYRATVPERYASAGLVNEQGERWQTLRNSLTPDLVSSRVISRFQPELDRVAEDFLVSLRSQRDRSSNRVANFEDFAKYMGLESTCTLILGRRMGFLDSEPDSRCVRLAQAVTGHFRACRDTYYGLPLWKIFPSSAYDLYKAAEEQYYDIISELVEEALKEENETCATESVRHIFMSILRAHNLDIREKKAAIVDFIAAGIVTLGNTLVFLLHLVATHPNVQQRLYEELTAASESAERLSGQELRNVPYLHAVVQECYRIRPTAICVARILEEDMELSGYDLPAGTPVLCQNWLACLDEANFTNAKKFCPERWMPGEISYKNFSPSLVKPFGFGRRVCPGKRFVDQMLHTILAKMVCEFHIEYEGEMEMQFEFLMVPASPVNLILRDRQ
ncbi:ecdysone 20-monooxygenase [Anabrus simplex]|uniref:ecdysone 20-monooxygenase n=1 Tax=Anabrus simplex TaxID=316456 RepID=UPI0034DD0385